MSSTPPPRTSFDSTTTASTAQRPLLEHAQQGGDVKAKIKAVFKKAKSTEEQHEQDKQEDGKKKKAAVPGSVKQGSFGGESSHMRMHM
ncbi:uncharacterized protein H6S33_002151 [Morchella sextelata]|uniref:uncharacterized protein n=1 Tax=Morchella sextelata TaxID=1174677 RepID=UPI001D046402|nr:uncharacterized protein H6S33_002151 [Morchella sextelata]KAH0608099.1 hypothetical protein H6S33_002151 [Morchella sextelata]